MQFLRFVLDGSECYGLLEDDDVRVLRGDPFDGFEETDELVSQEDVLLLAPCIPTKVIAVGCNYVDHAKELKMEVPDEPILFIKPPTSVIGQGGSIVYPAMSQQVDYEAELVAVIKSRAHRIEVTEAGKFILGYTCGNDVTARDLQRKDGQWTRAKSFDTFSPLGPSIVTDIDPANLPVRLRLNGETKQNSTTANMIFNVFELVSFASQVMTLLPGDVIMTGTPPGVGPMNVGDTVEVEIEGVGTLTNHVVAA